MNKKGQLDLDFSEIIGLIVLGIFLLFAIPLVTIVINAATSGNIENSINAIVTIFIPLFIFAIILEFIRRFFQ